MSQFKFLLKIEPAPVRRRGLKLAAGAAAIAALSACGGDSPLVNRVPAFVQGPVAQTHYDGQADDLLTAGLGKSGLAGAAPTYTNAAAPTASELRRNAIYVNYRALVDYTAAGGYGSFYGPNVDLLGVATSGEGKIAGTESIAVVDDGTGNQNRVLMVQVPDHFDPDQACIVTATSSGSRGVYGAIGTAGEWGLKRGCAVAYADKGSGNGFHDQQSDLTTRIDGTTGTASALGSAAFFRAGLSEAERSAFNTAYPNRVAYKHAHSRQNPEKDWGRATLQAVEFAFYVLNEQHGVPIVGSDRKAVRLRPGNTLVIASSVSNGGGAALAAAEQDTEGLIDGVAVSEPNVQPSDTSSLSIRLGTAEVGEIGKPLADYFSFANLYQPCALLSAQTTQTLAASFWPAAYATAAQNRCAALAARGLLTSATLAEQADEALGKLRAYGWAVDSDVLHQSHFRLATNSIVVTYVNAYGRFAVNDNVCGYSFANTDVSGAVVPQLAATQAGLFASGNGIPPTTGVNIVYNDAVGAPTLDFLAVSPTSATADFALDGALCLRGLVTGVDPVSGAALSVAQQAQSDRVRAGIRETLRSGRLLGKPTLIVAGRDDALIPVNHAARAYYGQHLLLEPGAPTRYYEVTHAQHFDAFIALGAITGFDTRYVPLHVYFNRAMDLMWAHLREGAPLPPSQVVRTTPRASGAPLAATDVPAFASAPAEADAIRMQGTVLTVSP